MKLHKYKIFCETDNKWERIIKGEDEPYPTTCPVDTGHTVTTDSQAVEQVIDTESQKDSDGAILSRPKYTTTGWHYQLHGIEFETSKMDSLYSKKEDNSDYGFGSIKFYESVSGVETEITGDDLNQTYLDNNCIKTEVDWEPNHDIEIVGGMLRQKQTPSEDVRLWVIGVPDIPVEFGGSKSFAVNINLSFLGQEDGVDVDGRSPKYLAYDPDNHTNKFRMIFRHSVGFKHQMSMFFEFFKE